MNSVRWQRAMTQALYHPTGAYAPRGYGNLTKRFFENENFQREKFRCLRILKQLTRL